jgi:methionyl-tRNA synthetase
VAVALSSYLPSTAPRILEALGQPDDLDWAGVAYGRSVAATGIEPAQPLFPRLDAPPAAA